MKKRGFRAEPVGPPAFRTAVHRFVPDRDGRRPHAVETAHRETPLDRPGIRVEATDRVYVVEPTGSLRRAAPRPVKHRPPMPFAAKVQKIVAASRIEADLEKTERRRVLRTMQKNQRLSERIDRAIGKAEAALALARGER